MSNFTKYDGGAYHWTKLEGTGLRLFHARLHARYGWFVCEARRRGARRIVDIGCGDGALTHLLAEATGAETLGIEPEEQGVEAARTSLARARSRAIVHRGSGEHLPVPDRSVTTVVMCEVIEHVPDPSAILCEVARVLMPQGSLLLSTPQRQHGPLPRFHVREYTSAELAEACREVFASVQVEVAEPSALLRAYGTRAGRVAINSLSLTGANPFAVRRPPSGRRRTWRQLYAVAEGQR